jgi:hypothetical protein
MITTKDGQDPRVLEDEFYADGFRFSYSSLSKLLYSPPLFYKHYVLKDKDEEVSKSMLEGSIVHCLLFNPEDFERVYTIAQCTVPGENVKDVIDKLHEIRMVEMDDPSISEARNSLAQYESEILDILKEKNLYQKMTDPVKISKIVNETGIEYFSFLMDCLGKTVIDTDTYSKCCEIVEKIKNNPVSKLMGLDDPDDCEVMSEVEISTGSDDFPFGLKGQLDNLVIDRKNKLIRINDLKITSKLLTDFPQAVIDYNYWLQAALYSRLAGFVSKATNSEDYTVVFNFVVHDKTGQIYAFEVSQDTMTEWQIDLQEKLHEAKYHYESRDYSLPYKFVKSKVML